MSGLRFAVMTAPQGGVAWTERVRRIEDGGWTAVLVPDTLWTTSPFPALAAAAAVTSTIRLRPWVLASPTRTTGALVREVQALQQLSEGRFELGIGTGRPDAAGEAERLGAAWGTAGERIAGVERAVAAVREQVTPVPPVAIAASGPRMLATAARLADRVAPALPPASGDDAFGAAVAAVREAAAGRGATPRFTLTLVGVGDRVAGHLARQGVDAGRLAADGAIGVLPADAGAAAALLAERHERFGVDELIVPDELVDATAPIAARLNRS